MITFLILYLFYFVLWLLAMHLYCSYTRFKLVKVKIKFVKEDAWLGIYYSYTEVLTIYKGERSRFNCIKYYFCIVPCFPVIFIWETDYFILETDYIK